MTAVVSASSDTATLTALDVKLFSGGARNASLANAIHFNEGRWTFADLLAVHQTVGISITISTLDTEVLRMGAPDLGLTDSINFDFVHGTDALLLTFSAAGVVVVTQFSNSLGTVAAIDDLNFVGATSELALSSLVLHVRCWAGANRVSDLELWFARAHLLAIALAMSIVTGTFGAFDQHLLVESAIHTTLAAIVDLHIALVARTDQGALLPAREAASAWFTLDIQVLVVVTLLDRLTLVTHSDEALLADTDLLVDPLSVDGNISVRLHVAVVSLVRSFVLADNLQNLVLVTQLDAVAFSSDQRVSRTTRADLTASLSTIARVPLESLPRRALLANRLGHLIVAALPRTFAAVSDSDVS